MIKQIRMLEASRFALDGGAMFGVVPKNMWSKSYHLGDEMNRVPLSSRVLFVETDANKIVIDCGIGDKFDSKYRSVYGLEAFSGFLTPPSLTETLEANLIGPESIDSVIITHLHFDHCGGATVKSKSGTIEPALPNARHYIQKSQWNRALNPSVKDRASYLSDNYLPLYDCGIVEFIDGCGEILPNIKAEVVNGHSAGMQIVYIQDDCSSYLYAADLIPTSAHINNSYIMAYDNEPLISIEEKSRILKKCLEDDTTILLEHDRFCEAVRIGQIESKIKIMAKIENFKITT
jgi:glyoxylase-like metal-dependent hydrolase (beta-lactamase superfamily II)